jgi:hypothetical protein
MFSNYDIKEVKLNDIRSFIETNHYSKNVNGLKVNTCIGLYIDGELKGGCIFGSLSTTAWKRYVDREDKIIELRRLILTDDLPRNSESYFISKCISI